LRTGSAQPDAQRVGIHAELSRIALRKGVQSATLARRGEAAREARGVVMRQRVPCLQLRCGSGAERGIYGGMMGAEPGGL
jgi:hypothetical protein